MIFDDRGRGIHSDPSIDDSYWAALFQMEEAIDEDVELGLSDDSLPLPLENLPLPDSYHSNGDHATVAPTELRPKMPGAALSADDPWDMARAYMENDRVLKLRVLGHNKGGLLVSWNGLQGFVPASQLINFPQFHIPRERLQSLAEWRDRTLELKIIEVNQPNSRLILSERATLVAADQRAILLRGVRAGERLEGVVTNLTDFGAFVDLGGIEGLIHISEISWSRVVHPSAVLRPGQRVAVLVLSVDHQLERVALSMKRLRPNPWATAGERYQPGQQVRGVVGNITTYGAFIILEEELEGLVHISELAEGAFMHPRDIVRSGEVVAARVISVDSHNKRIALSLRGVGQNPGAGS
jgi:small subunit ribosomal protein S1